jgi:geranylgeranyl diphosphate synthase, type II
VRLSPRLQPLLQSVERPLSVLFRNRSPEGLYEPMAYVLSAGGKRIRPLLLLVSAESVGGSARESLDAALAVELLHTFTLVHDDIMDHDVLRRGRPTVHRRWDEATAILAGDGLVTAAYASLLKTRHPRLPDVLERFTGGLAVLCEGQALDKAYEREESVGLDGYLDMIGKKTAKLIETACAMGGILGGGTEREIGALGDFGSGIGMAFQIQDDLLDLVASEEILGKPVGSDIAERKKTFLTIHFLAAADGTRRDRFRRLWGRRELTADDIGEIRTLFAETGTLDAAVAAVGKATDSALSALSAVRPGPRRDDLAGLARSLLERDR